MLISPPFLPARNEDETDSVWLDRAMRTVGDGAFPVGTNCCWHGGVHLEAPQDENGAGHLPVRAIADGIVRFVRQDTAMPEDDAARDAHALGYEGWTSDGVVVIEHETDIGAAADGTAVTVLFYSIYHHLTEIPADIALNRRVYRKATLGEAGYIAGQPNRIHFEIVCNDTNLQNLIGRTTGELNTETDGRSDVVFGELYFRLPSGTEIFTVPAGRRMHYASAAAQTVLANAAANTPNPPQAIAAAGTSTEVCYVGLRYAHGEGAANHRGDLAVTTYLENATVYGAADDVLNGEYDLYKTAKAISESYPAGGRPAPSAVYELLRFGRVINTTNETLTPADVPHWREVVLPTTAGQITGWVNLNANGIRKFSDADFPHWRGWKIHDDDDAPNDNRCNSARLKAEFDENGDHVVTAAELGRRMQEQTVREKMYKAICSIPSEWNADNVEAGWSWLQERTDENPDPVTGENFTALCRHHRALCFAGGTALNATRHFHPRGFIETFRKCGWLSLNELAQTYPRYPFYPLTGTTRSALTTSNNQVSRNTARNRFSDFTNPLNLCLRKYIGYRAERFACFLAQVMLETAQWRSFTSTWQRRLHEWGFGAVNQNIPMTQYYTCFYGRGIMQLTWAGNYRDYGEYKNIENHTSAYTERRNLAQPRITATSQHAVGAPDDQGHVTYMTWSPRYDPDIIAEDNFLACDSGGWFWVSKPGVGSINRRADLGVTTHNVTTICKWVNGGSNGYADRLAYTTYILRTLSEDTNTNETVTIPSILNTPSNLRPTVIANMQNPE